ncbi:RNA polymerase sigma factor [Thalassotalea insulae]|uniref:RNA polymerase sigma factor n=1 Tax=Thalassotalea insulae TaxID=2056778 RepID=A0ABQ6GQX3_9GAMM|nr:sigma-70 family RNA polymerase sigma factor [Thalassotalea insulae]GLX78342.1 RNA polymerase sigma factor [Thalassotalea insulae]
MDSKELARLLAKTALHDQQAFERLYLSTAAKLNGIAYRILHNSDLAHEVLQEAFIQIWHNAIEYRIDKAEPFTWMASIVRYRCYDRVRSEQRRLENKHIQEQVESIEQIAAINQPTTQMCEIGQDLADCLEQLEDVHRRGILMAYYFGFSRGEISDHLEKPINTIKSWLRRGLARLQQCLEK